VINKSPNRNCYPTGVYFFLDKARQNAFELWISYLKKQFVLGNCFDMMRTIDSKHVNMKNKDPFT